jgi:hypothetical protein
MSLPRCLKPKLWMLPERMRLAIVVQQTRFQGGSGSWYLLRVGLLICSRPTRFIPGSAGGVKAVVAGEAPAQAAGLLLRAGVVGL